MTVLIMFTLAVSASALSAPELKIYYTFDKESYLVGDTVTVTLHLDRIDGITDSYNLQSLETAVLFHATYLRYTGTVSVAAGIRIGDDSFSYNQYYDQIPVTFNALNAASERSAALEVAVFSFEALANVSDGTLFHKTPTVYTSMTEACAVEKINGTYIIGDPEAEKFEVSFSGGIGSEGTAPVFDAEAAAGESLILPANPYTMENGRFVGWSDGTDTYNAGDTYVMPEKNTSFIAVWELAHSVSFTAGGGAGDVPDLVYRYAGDTFALPNCTFICENHTFNGWDDGTETIQPGHVYTMPDNALVFAALWKSDEDGTIIGGGGTGGISGEPTSEEHLCDAFRDIVGHWAKEGICYVVENGIMNGIGSDTFSPDTNMTRAMLVTVLYRMEGSPEVTADNPFSDVKNGAYYTEPVIWATGNNIVNGYGSGLFGPEDNITRQQIAAILYRYAIYKDCDVSAAVDLNVYHDASDIADWAFVGMRWANAEGFITGRTADTLEPGGTAKRAEVATILMRFLEDAAD